MPSKNLAIFRQFYPDLSESTDLRNSSIRNANIAEMTVDGILVTDLLDRYKGKDELTP